MEALIKATIGAIGTVLVVLLISLGGTVIRFIEKYVEGYDRDEKEG
ncbi:hypothetical protein [Salinibacter ruber]|jgi:hypothetical protein|nr:hypothetical protein [Salinibacter ruber]MCS3685803.1 hypothetical protein [Salinibacter ruber]